MKRPNVMLICADHWPGLLLGAQKHEYVHTHTLNQLCENGILFSNACSSTPSCIPARRAIMTGTTAKTHGDRVFNQKLKMDKQLITMPQTFRNAGYQAYAVGKMHVYPQRDRIGFDDVILNEEGRHHLGLLKDDYEVFLSDNGYAGQELTHAMGVNEYTLRPWHLQEQFHPTYWTTKQMCRMIQRRDPKRPSFWYCSYTAPHPPLTPPSCYIDMYRHTGVDKPYIGSWANEVDNLPYALKAHYHRQNVPCGNKAVEIARQGFYAQCTYLDHQIRLIIGTLREEGILDETIIMFISDHGDMLGNHGLWAKPVMFENAIRIPMILVPTAEYVEKNKSFNIKDERLAELSDVMPTLLDMCDIPNPDTVEGYSLVSDKRRDNLYFEHYEDEKAMRMVRTKSHKLIYYPMGNIIQLFDLKNDPLEIEDASENSKYKKIKEELIEVLKQKMYGTDQEYIKDGKLIGLPAREYHRKSNRSLRGQRGWR